MSCFVSDASFELVVEIASAFRCNEAGGVMCIEVWEGIPAQQFHYDETGISSFNRSPSFSTELSHRMKDFGLGPVTGSSMEPAEGADEIATSHGALIDLWPTTLSQPDLRTALLHLARALTQLYDSRPAFIRLSQVWTALFQHLPLRALLNGAVNEDEGTPWHDFAFLLRSSRLGDLVRPNAPFPEWRDLRAEAAGHIEKHSGRTSVIELPGGRYLTMMAGTHPGYVSLLSAALRPQALKLVWAQEYKFGKLVTVYDRVRPANTLAAQDRFRALFEQMCSRRSGFTAYYRELLTDFQTARLQMSAVTRAGRARALQEVANLEEEEEAGRQEQVDDQDAAAGAQGADVDEDALAGNAEDEEEEGQILEAEVRTTGDPFSDVRSAQVESLVDRHVEELARRVVLGPPIPSMLEAAVGSENWRLWFMSLPENVTAVTAAQQAEAGQATDWQLNVDGDRYRALQAEIRNRKAAATDTEGRVIAALTVLSNFSASARNKALVDEARRRMAEEEEAARIEAERQRLRALEALEADIRAEEHERSSKLALQRESQLAKSGLMMQPISYSKRPAPSTRYVLVKNKDPKKYLQSLDFALWPDARAAERARKVELDAIFRRLERFIRRLARHSPASLVGRIGEGFRLPIGRRGSEHVPQLTWRRLVHVHMRNKMNWLYHMEQLPLSRHGCWFIPSNNGSIKYPAHKLMSGGNGNRKGYHHLMSCLRNGIAQPAGYFISHRCYNGIATKEHPYRCINRYHLSLSLPADNNDQNKGRHGEALLCTHRPACLHFDRDTGMARPAS